MPKEFDAIHRICWNTREWERPSGSSNEGDFVKENGFGYEEWNFQLADTWNGYIFPYMRKPPSRERFVQNEGKLSIGFYVIHPDNGEDLLVGIHHDVELIQEHEYSEIEQVFKEKGIYERRADELWDAIRQREKIIQTREGALNEINKMFNSGADIIRVKSPVDGVKIIQPPRVINLPNMKRFGIIYEDKFPVPFYKSPTPPQTSALSEDGYYRETKSNLHRIIPRHNELSNDFCRWLNGRKISARQETNGIDILFDIGNVRCIAELKVVYGIGTTKAIREAMGQLLEYNYYPDREPREEWMVIIDQCPSGRDKRYIDMLRSEVKLPLRLGWQTDKGFEFHPAWPD